MPTSSATRTWAAVVLSSIMKQSCTERGRRVVQDGMDVIAGAGIVGGHANFLGNAYMAMPVAITVEGANIMTRSFQIIGQGLTRCHPHMLPLIDSLQSTDADAPAKFRTQFGTPPSPQSREPHTPHTPRASPTSPHPSSPPPTPSP